MIVVGYNPRPLSDFFTKRRTASSTFDPDRLDAIYRAIERHGSEWSPSVSVSLFGATAEDFAS